MHHDYKDSERQVKALARRVLRRTKALGLYGVEIEDIVGELQLAWTIAAQRFDPQHGVPFGAYLHRGMLNHINRWVDAQLDERHGCSLDDVLGEDATLADAVADANAVSPEDAVALSSRRDLVMRNLPDETRMFVELLERPSDGLVEILEGARSRAEFARSRGIRAVAPTDVTTSMVFDLMGLDRGQRHDVLTDLNFWAQR